MPCCESKWLRGGGNNIRIYKITPSIISPPPFLTLPTSFFHVLSVHPHLSLSPSLTFYLSLPISLSLSLPPLSLSLSHSLHAHPLSRPPQSHPTLPSHPVPVQSKRLRGGGNDIRFKHLPPGIELPIASGQVSLQHIESPINIVCEHSALRRYL